MRTILLVTALALPAFAAGGGSGPAAPARLSQEHYETVRAYASPRPEDEVFRQVVWHDNLVDAANEARRLDRPLVLWLYFGDARGGC